MVSVSCNPEQCKALWEDKGEKTHAVWWADNHLPVLCDVGLTLSAAFAFGNGGNVACIEY